jgi:hypothetical protein
MWPSCSVADGHAASATAADASPAQLLDAALRAAVALGDRCYQLMYPVRPPRQRRSARQLAGTTAWRLLNGPRVRHALRSASHYESVRRLRLVIWRVLMRPGRPADEKSMAHFTRTVSSSGVPVRRLDAGARIRRRATMRRAAGLRPGEPTPPEATGAHDDSSGRG